MIDYFHFINIVSKSQKIIFPTTNSGYGIGNKNEYCNENSKLNPISQYGKDKADVEKKFLDTKSILSYIYYNCYFDEWTQNDFYKNIKILDESIIKYSDKKLKPLITNNRVANKKIKVGFFSSDLIL